MITLEVLETNILHASDVIYWVDGTTAASAEAMLRLAVPLAVDITTRPADLQTLVGVGKTALWLRSSGKMVAGVADEADKSFPSASSFVVAGAVRDPDGRYNPRRFSITAGTAGSHSVVVYPSPLGTRFGKSGGLVGTLRWAASEKPVPWALLTLEVTTALGAPQVFRAQANGHGDFSLCLKRLPPLPEGVTHYEAALGAAALATADADSPVDPADLTGALLGDPLGADTFSAAIGLPVVPGDIRLIRSFEKDYLSVQPS